MKTLILLRVNIHEVRQVCDSPTFSKLNCIHYSIFNKDKSTLQKKKMKPESKISAKAAVHIYLSRMRQRNTV